MTDVASRPTRTRAPTIATGLAVLVALVLAWRVVVAGLERPGEGGGPPLGGPSAAESGEKQWRTLLARNPADYAAMVMLALDLERQGRKGEAHDAMDQAVRLAPANQRTLLEAAALAAREGDEAAMLGYLRRTVDLYPESGAKVWPAFVSALEGGRHADFFAGAAREGPAWWPAFFVHACQNGGNVDALQWVLAVRLEARTASADERRCLLGRLQQSNEWPRAYQLWLNGLPPSQRQHVGRVFNGGFQNPISNLGFDWTLPPRDGVFVEQQSTPGATGGQALKVEFVNKRWIGPPIQQVLLLEPGRYAFEGRGRAQALDSWLGLQWGVYCRKDDGTAGRQLARSDRWVGTSPWSPMRFDLVVSRDCPVQLLRLELANPRDDARVPGDVAARLRGTVWFDDFQLRRLD